MAALGWQFVWTYQFGLLLGHELVSLLAVMAAFLGGLGLGAFAFHQALSASKRPRIWFVVSEAVIAAWGLAVVYALPHIGPQINSLIGTEPSSFWHWLIAFLVPFLMLLPASLAMGLTVPALELGEQNSLEKLYSFNTLGALLGVFTIVFLAVPVLGIKGSACLCAAANLLSAWLAWLYGKDKALKNVLAQALEKPLDARPEILRKTTLVLLLFCTGLLGVGYQVLVVRVLSQVHENTVFSYALVLAVYLLGTAVGSYRRPQGLRAYKRNAPTLASLLTFLLISLTGSVISLWWADVWVDFPGKALAQMSSLPNNSLDIDRIRMIAPLLGEFFVAFIALFLPSVMMARVFTRLCALSKENSGASVGRAFAINTLGAALAPALIALVTYPRLGAGYSVLAIVLGYLVLIVVAKRLDSHLDSSASATGIHLKWLQAPNQGPRFAYTLIAGFGIAAVISLASQRPLRFINIPEGGQLIKYEDGVLASVSIVRDVFGVDRLHINNREQEGSSAKSAIETRLGLLPVLLHPAPGRALFLGYGTGFTATTAAKDKALKVTAVELLPEVIAASSFFQSVATPRSMEALKLINADGRRFIQTGHEQYDVIVADLFHPARNGAGAIYTSEHFKNVSERLAPEGLFCQWLALHQMELSTLQSIVASYLQVFPNAAVVLASNSLDTPVIGLISKRDAKIGEPLFDFASIEQRLRLFPNQGLLKQAKLDNAVAVLGSLLTDARSLRDWSSLKQANTDDHPVVIHEAPWATYHPKSTPRDRLFTLLSDLKAPAPDLVKTKDVQAFQTLASYWQAREDHLRLGKRVQAEADPEKVLNQIQRPMLDILTRSPNFQPAFEPLIALASAIALSNRPRAIEVLQALRNIRPNDIEVAQAIARLEL
jgi:spermidine synthase